MTIDDNNVGKTLTRTVDRSNSKIFFKRREAAPISDKDSDNISYKNPDFLKQFTSEGGRILPRRITNVSAKNQRKIKRAVKLARILALLPFVDDSNK
jgi:small subunit ribosomal protein S18